MIATNRSVRDDVPLTTLTKARPGVAAALLLSAMLVPIAAASDETLERVRELYRSAEYEQALAVLDQGTADPALAGSLEAREYRVFCLIALGRIDEARASIESLLNVDPFHEVAQASPRVRSLFAEVRQAVLPRMAQRAYADAKAAFDRQDPQSADRFARVLALLDDPDLAGVPTLTDLRTVAAAFRDLSEARVARIAAPPAARVAASAAAPAVAASAPAADAAPPVVYREGEADIVPAEPVQQSVPSWVPPRLTNGADPRTPQGVLEVIIDEQGAVTSARVIQSFHPVYDAQLVKAAMSWKYKPARRGGTPVRSAKVVNVRYAASN